MRFRADISESVIHFIKGANDKEAFDVLTTILTEGALRGSPNLIKGEYAVVCFTESPLEWIGKTLLEAKSRYRAFGVRVSKKWLFAQGGRPVIYQANEEFESLRETHRWRHVRYEPDREPPIDFLWEREWRIRTDELAIQPAIASVIVPDPAWCNELWEHHEWVQDAQVERIAQQVPPIEAEQYRESFPWTLTIVDPYRGNV